MKYILKFSYKKSIIDKSLLPWKENKDDSISIEYQIGVALNKYIITPFFIYIPYAECSLLNIENGDDIKLKLNKYCYFRRIAIFNIEDKIEYILLENYNYDLSKIECLGVNKYYINTFDENIIIYNLEIEFLNIKDNQIYQFIWLKGNILNIDKEIIDILIPGIPIYDINHIFIGIIYNVIDEFVYIIPYINIEKCILEETLLNIFIDLIEDSNIISNIHNNKSLLEIGDEILTINDNILNTKRMIYDNKLKIELPLHTYIWYNNKKKYNILIIRNRIAINLIINSEELNKRLSIKIEEKTKEYIIEQLIFCNANILMFEWIIFNNIMPKCKIYLEYKINPYYKMKSNYLLVGIYNLENHPFNVRDKIKKHLNYEYEFGKVLAIPEYKTLNLDNIKSINILIISNSNDEEIELNWLK
jgi:hypothetical protein